jgi:hypothetical protein
MGDGKSRSVVHVTRKYEHLQSKPSIARQSYGSLCRRERNSRRMDDDDVNDIDNIKANNAMRNILFFGIF